jgi:branched-chain amino acid transport system ATP-binding protein
MKDIKQIAPMIVADIFTMIRELRDRGAAILLVERNMHQALALTDCFCVIERGRIVVAVNAKSEPDRKALFGAITI